VKVFDVRAMRGELSTLKGHRREVTSTRVALRVRSTILSHGLSLFLARAAIAWHPMHEDLLTSGGADGSIYFWTVGREQPQAEMGRAHEQQVWALAWHPVGHILASVRRPWEVPASADRWWGAVVQRPLD
jgi:polyadenylation factor subunit 2